MADLTAAPKDLKTWSAELQAWCDEQGLEVRWTRDGYHVDEACGETLTRSRWPGSRTSRRDARGGIEEGAHTMTDQTATPKPGARRKGWGCCA